MKKVDVYIDTYFKGRGNSGEGVYTLVLELIGKNNIPKTRTSVKGILHTTKNRTAMLAVIEALERFKEPCYVTVHINNNYVVQSMEQDWTKEKNKDLWIKLIELSAIHETKYMFAQRNQYTAAMESEMKHMEIDFEEDEMQ